MKIRMRLCYREIVTRDHQRKHSAEPTVLIDHRPESRSFHIFYNYRSNDTMADLALPENA